MKDTPQPNSSLIPAAIAGMAGRGGPESAALPKQVGRVASWAGASFLLGLSYYFPVHPGLDMTTNQSLSTLTWPAPAMGLALLWRRSMREWPIYLLAAAAGLAFVSTIGAQPLALEHALAGLGLLGVTLGAWLGRRFVAPEGQLDSSRRLVLFTLLLPVALSLLLSVLMSALLWWSSDADWTAQWARIYVAHAMALLTLVPALLIWGTAEATAVFRERGNWLPILAAFACMALALVPRMHDEVIRAALTLPLCWAAVRSGMALVTQLNAAITLGMMALTLAGFGPYVEYGYGIWALQVDLIGIAILSLLLAVTIGERQRLAARLDQARRFESLGFLAGGIAHDFNNVLATIRACAEIAGERLAPDNAGRAELAQLERATERGIDMTQQILLAARQGDPARSCVDLAALVEEALEMARPLCPSRVRIAHTLPPGAAAPQVLANRGQLLRAVQNLLRNATQAARHNVTIAVGAHRPLGQHANRFDVQLGEPAGAPGSMGWVEVADDGPGIEAAHWPHLFDPFYSTRQAQGGTGLGLAIVAGVASAHGGFVGMATSPGRGTVFRLEVPLFQGSGAAGAAFQ